ncbi:MULTISPECIES: hypothetical protein [unclassified Rhizobium]|uniref:hypothetical protein n=1 Tax=unclassified Rhizobium TaxID=2613769 RepID=UPI00161C77FE|nr:MULTISPECIES: hypothetical protein [unclassified Rhizobium]MBB3385523.1 uncharacterized protein (DUF1778 family) [Rhizobium sp. BK098]MBB3617228.1 uncharacterized protein (DUF1778 family) [Rhizobium sp. BK609]MBB3682936.1 uncharacterized protein (DUF1778 family) [Rhizobium sp. BK612]
MAVSLKKSSKSETLTIRLDPKSRFMLEFLSRLKGQTITTVVERAIADAANRETVLLDNPFSANPDEKTWRDFWSVSDAERNLKLARLPDVHPTFEEERRLDFAKRWWQFFFVNAHAMIVDRQLADILWPQIDHFIEIEKDNQTTNVLAAGDAMAKALRGAGIEPPDWIPSNASIPF